MNTYELSYITSSEVSSEEAESFTKTIDSFIQEKGGVIISSDVPIIKGLAYPVKNHVSGFMKVLEFQIEPEKLQEIIIHLNKEVKILRKTVLVKETPRRHKKKRGMRPELKPEQKSVSLTEEGTQPESDTKKSEDEKRTKTDIYDIDKEIDEILGE